MRRASSWTTPPASGSTTRSTSGRGPRTWTASASVRSATGRKCAGSTTRSSRLRLLALLWRRLVWFVPTLLGLLAVTFVISRVMPADPVALVAGETATPAQVEALRRQLGFDRPLPVQFVDYVARLTRGDMGTGIFTRRPI